MAVRKKRMGAQAARYGQVAMSTQPFRPLPFALHASIRPEERLRRAVYARAGRPGSFAVGFAVFLRSKIRTRRISRSRR